MKIPAVARLRPGSAHCRRQQRGPRDLASPNPSGTPALHWGPQGDLAHWHGGTGQGEACKREERQACGQGLRGPQQLKQDGRALFSSPGRAWAGSGQKARPDCGSASVGRGAWQGREQSAELGVMPCVPGAFPPNQSGGGARDSDGEGALSVTRVGHQRWDMGET